MILMTAAVATPTIEEIVGGKTDYSELRRAEHAMSRSI